MEIDQRPEISFSCDGPCVGRRRPRSDVFLDKGLEGAFRQGADLGRVDRAFFEDHQSGYGYEVRHRTLRG